MAIYRYSPESIEPRARRTQNQQSAYLFVLVGVICVAGHALMDFDTALIMNAVFIFIACVVQLSSRQKTRQRIVDWMRSTELEIDDSKATLRSKMGETSIQRLEIGEAYFSTKVIWLRRQSSSTTLRITADFDNFERLSGSLKSWLPQSTPIRSTPPSSVWALSERLLLWVGAPSLLYAAMASESRAIGIPASIVAGVGIAWYFAWCGRKIDERKWQILLPGVGYAVAVALGLRAFKLWLAP